jgi:hypothetical protein
MAPPHPAPTRTRSPAGARAAPLEWTLPYRAGALDAFDVDQVLFQYYRAAKELWKFCNHLPVEIAAAMIQEQPPHDWWERGAPRKR